MKNMLIEVVNVSSREKTEIEKRKNEIIGILLVTLGILSSIALFTSTTGILGNILSNIYKRIFGTGGYIFPFLFIIWGITLIRLKGLKFNLKLTGFLISLITLFTLYHTYLYKSEPLNITTSSRGGGVLGGILSWILLKLFGETGTYVILTTLLLIGILLWFDLFLHSLFSNLTNFFKNIFSGKDNDAASKRKKIVEEDTFYEDIEQGEITCEAEITDNDKEIKETDIKEDVKEVKYIQENSENGLIDNENYVLPQLNLLKKSKNRNIKFIRKNKLLEETLKSFGVEAKVIGINHGPTITRYEVQPATGVKVSKIVSLADDISLALAAPDVRIEAPIPGKAAVGIEVPHSGNNLVRIKEVLSSREYQNANSKLTLALGKDIEGKPVIADLAKMPHLLVAGATGSGKSMCINTIITSLLYKSKPDEVKFILIDPKKVELSHYKGLPHLFTPVVTDPSKASHVLKLVVKEMETRYELFSDTGTRAISSYNNQIENDEDRLPYIVVIIDELSDLMMVSANEVEDNICRLAQMSRAAGIHLVIATQRPSVDVITGLIKANIPSRISFAVSSQTDSRTILDVGGAEKLLGNGDMLFAPVDAKKPQRIQGAFIEDDEIRRIMTFVQKQADPEFEVEAEDIQEVEISIDDERDELYEEAVTLVVNYRASISMLQRRLHIGHSRAARLIDQMEEEGIVGPYAGSKPREVLISKEDLEKYINIDKDINGEDTSDEQTTH